MQEANTSPLSIPHSQSTPKALEPAEEQVVSTHVLVGEAQVHQLRELSRRSRIAQSEYLREAVDDLLEKYAEHTAAGEQER